MKTIKVKTWLPVFPGFYGTIFEPETDTVIEDPYTYDDYDFDFAGYEQDCSKECCIAIQEKLKQKGFNCKIQFEQLRSPREYNFSNDAIDVTVKITSAFITRLQKFCQLSTFATYLERYKSCSGFISSYSHYASDWLTYIDADYLTDNPHILGSLLEFVLQTVEYDSEALYYDVYDKCYLYGEVKESSLPTEFELNGLVFAGNYDEIKENYDNWIGTCFDFFNWCLINLKQIVYNDPNQLTLPL
jgi:hypothetical protein